MVSISKNPEGRSHGQTLLRVRAPVDQSKTCVSTLYGAKSANSTYLHAKS